MASALNRQARAHCLRRASPAAVPRAHSFARCLRLRTCWSMSSLTGLATHDGPFRLFRHTTASQTQLVRDIIDRNPCQAGWRDPNPSTGRVCTMSTKPSSVAVAVAAVLLLAAAGTAPVLRAQAVSSATVTGRVTDQQTAIIPNARIQITAVETGAVYSALTNADGIYTIPNLP